MTASSSAVTSTAASSSPSGCATGVVTAGMNVNVWDVNEHVQELIRSRKQVDEAKLTDPDTPLESLV